ncbi:calcium homeostasis modulator protein 4 [Xenopus laevis]|uniref:Calcium homeostasis modulator protein 4 n=4 Tax=Xenopus laevis TaxID=8355 RepID=A0A1L8G958_XENLA|nr:calcium homeostasis modulator protein 4 [Xenopus laevis]OCT80326.1 hypothetical protein XELAEV_18027146mg [Xenopus laevis]
MPLQPILSFLKSKESILFNSVVAILTVGGQQLFSFFAFSCPCSPSKNLNYGLAFLGVPALVLLVVGFAFNDNTWRLLMGSSNTHAVQERGRQSITMRYKLICFVCGNITGRAMVAPITWLAVTLLNGSYYVCALSEYADVEQYDILRSLTEAERRRFLSQFPCAQFVPANLTRVKDEVILELKYQSQVAGWILVAVVAVSIFVTLCVARCCSPLTFLHLKYWSSYVNNEQMLFEQAADQHSKIYALLNIKKFFGFSPGSKNITEIRIPSRWDWRTISGLDLLKTIDDEHCHYSLLHSWADLDPADGKLIHVNLENTPGSD